MGTIEMLLKWVTSSRSFPSHTPPLQLLLCITGSDRVILCISDSSLLPLERMKGPPGPVVPQTAGLHCRLYLCG